VENVNVDNEIIDVKKRIEEGGIFVEQFKKDLIRLEIINKFLKSFEEIENE